MDLSPVSQVSLNAANLFTESVPLESMLVH